MGVWLRTVPFLALVGCAAHTFSRTRDQKPVPPNPPRTPDPKETINHLKQLLQTDTTAGLNLLLSEVQKFPRPTLPGDLMTLIDEHQGDLVLFSITQDPDHLQNVKPRLRLILLTRKAMIDYMTTAEAEALEIVPPEVRKEIERSRVFLSEYFVTNDPQLLERMSPSVKEAIIYGDLIMNYAVMDNSPPYDTLPPALRQVIEENRQSLLTYIMLADKIPFPPDFLLNLSLRIMHLYSPQQRNDLLESSARHYRHQHQCFRMDDHPVLQTRSLLPFLPVFLIAGLQGGGCSSENIESILTDYTFRRSRIDGHLVNEIAKSRDRWPNTPEFATKFMKAVKLSKDHTREVEETVRYLFESIPDQVVAERSAIPIGFYASAHAFVWLLNLVPLEEKRAFIEKSLEAKPNFALALYESARRTIENLPDADRKALEQVRERLLEHDRTTEPKGSRTKHAEMIRELDDAVQRALEPLEPLMYPPRKQ
ncbi:MAG: hypothetical protein HYT76_06455 [Deltaproteobacteria bacterium]|nr:hypothetical protein [Deltaproteobacteria bacterium]